MRCTDILGVCRIEPKMSFPSQLGSIYKSSVGVTQLINYMRSFKKLTIRKIINNLFSSVNARINESGNEKKLS